MQLSCIIKAEDDETFNAIIFSSSLDGVVFQRALAFDIEKNKTNIFNPDLKERVILQNLLSSENRTLVEFNPLICEDSMSYKCEVQLPDYNLVSSTMHPIIVKGLFFEFVCIK